MKLATLDVVIVLVYLAGIFALAQWVSREKAGHQKSTTDYFLERLGLAAVSDLPPIAPHLPEAADLAAELAALAIIPDDVEETYEARAE